MIIWRYYLKMLHFEQFLVPTTMTGICLLLIVLMKTLPNPVYDVSPSIAIAFMEAALPLATAIVATGLLLNDPTLELHYTVPRPFWRTLLEKLVLLVGIMTVFYVVFNVLTRMMGVPISGWAVSPIAPLIWLIPAVTWVGLAFLIAAGLRNSVAGSGLTALLWIVCFMLHDLMMGTASLRTVYPLMTTFQFDSSDWPANRAALLLIGAGSLTLALLLLRNGEHYFKPES